jgi:hypothetical protein
MTLDKENLHRGAKILVDLKLVKSWEEAYEAIGRYRFGIDVGKDAGASVSGQACLLTMVNCGARSCPGGVFVSGLSGDEPLVSPLGTGKTLGAAVRRCGGTLCEAPQDGMPLILVGDTSIEKHDGAVLRATFGGWSGGVAPIWKEIRLPEDSAFPPAAVLAGSLAVSECFALLLGTDHLAGDRALGLSLLKPGEDWTTASARQPIYMPSSLWLLGLGHLGQAYAWTLASLPFPEGNRADVVLQDFDVAVDSNLSTSVLTMPVVLGYLKTRIVSKWLERRGFKTRMVERRFVGEIVLGSKEPRVLVCGVDNLPTRRLLEKPKFSLVVDAGLGVAASDYDGFCIQTFTNKGRAQNAFPESKRRTKSDPAGKNPEAYKGLGLDDCGMHLAADAAVGVPFVGIAVSTLVIAEICRALAGEKLLDTTSGSLSNLCQVDSVTVGTRIKSPAFISQS